MPAELLGAAVGGRGARRALTGEKPREPLPGTRGGEDRFLPVEQLERLADEPSRLRLAARPQLDLGEIQASPTPRSTSSVVSATEMASRPRRTAFRA